MVSVEQVTRISLLFFSCFLDLLQKRHFFEKTQVLVLTVCVSFPDLSTLLWPGLLVIAEREVSDVED